MERASLKTSSKHLYLVPVLLKALDILELLEAEKRQLSLEAIHRETKLSKTTVYRALKTFVHRGYLLQSNDGLYRRVSQSKKWRFGFGSQSADMTFSNEVMESLKQAAFKFGVDLVILDNSYDGPTGIRNAERFVEAGVDLVIEFQVKHEVGPIIADRIADAGIPLIAVDIPHPHSTYFGVDNFRVGVDAGEALAAYAVNKWGSRVNWVIGLDLPDAGQLVQSRIIGAFEGVRVTLKDLPDERFVRMDGRGMRERSANLISEFLHHHPRDKHILIAAATDTSALGALDAVRKERREKHVAIVGQDCIAESILQMRRPHSALIGSVSHEAGSYGESLIRLGFALLRGQTVAPYNYVPHRLVMQQSLPAL